jgi:Holliday junction resolvase RusA-like endonuclease
MNVVAIDLPRPPSVNKLYANVPGKGRVKTPDYRSWIDQAGWLIRAQRPGKIQGEYKLLVLIGPTKADIGNIEKALSDLLQDHGVVENDRLADSILLERSNDIPPQTIRCYVMEEDTWVPLSNAVASVLQNIAKVSA